MRVDRFAWDGHDAPGLAWRLRSLVPALGDVSAEVSAIIEQVRAGGDDALLRIGERLGEAVPESLRVDPEAVAAAPGLLEPEVRDALRAAARNVEAVARAELEVRSRPAAVELPEGQRVEVREEPVAAIGVYAPGGRAAYPSSVLMCCIPARVAGVVRLCVASPPGAAGRPSAAVLAACAIAGADEVYAVGGAQAIAALAFGTETVQPVDLICGPGNRYVAEAKRQVSATVGLDRVAELAQELAAERPSVADAPLALVATRGLEVALTLADAVAPEHLELQFEGADETVAR